MIPTGKAPAPRRRTERKTMQQITWNPARQLWETEQADLFSERQEPFSETWPTSGMTRSGRLLPLPASAHPIDGNECSSSPQLPTPKAHDGVFGTPRTSGRPIEKSTHLQTIVGLLPTPRATDGTKGGPNQLGSSGDLMPPSAAGAFPFPRNVQGKCGLVGLVDNYNAGSPARQRRNEMAAKRRKTPYKVLVAAVGHRPTDFSHADKGEVVILNPMVCDDRSGRCGCDRALVGMKSRKATTVATVAVVELSDSDVAELVAAYKEAWDGCLSDEECRGFFDESVEVASKYPNGATVRVQAAGDEWDITGNAPQWWDISAEVPSWFADLGKDKGVAGKGGGK